MTDRGSVAEYVLGKRHRVCQLQRLDESRTEGGVPDLAGDDLDHATEQREAGVAVRHRRADRMHLPQRRAGRDVLLERIVAATRVGEVVAVDAARMREQMPDRHRPGDALVGDREIGDVATKRRVQLDEPLVDELHDDGRGPHLRDRSDLEQRLVVDSTPVSRLSTPDATVLISRPEDGERGARHAVLRDAVVEPLLEGRASDRERHGTLLRRGCRRRELEVAEAKWQNE